MTLKKKLGAKTFVAVTAILTASAITHNVLNNSSLRDTVPTSLHISEFHNSDSNIEWKYVKNRSQNQKNIIAINNDTLSAELTRLSKVAFSSSATAETIKKLEGFINRQVIESPTNLLKAIFDLDKTLFSFDTKTTLYTIAIESWSKIDLETLCHWLEKNNSSGEFDSVISGLALAYDNEPNIYLKLALYINDLDEQGFVIHSVLKNWIKDDTQSAASWATSNTNVFDVYAEDIFKYLIDIDIPRTISALAIFEAENINIYRIAISLIGEKINEESMSQSAIYDSTVAILALPHGGFKNEAIYAIFPSILNQLDISDTKLLLAEMPEGENKKSLNLLVTNRLAMSDIHQALNYTESIENPITKSEAVESVINHWAKYDLQSTSEWLRSNNHVNDKSVRTMIKAALREKDIRVAKAWINQLDKSDTDKELHMEMIRLLNETDESEALFYLDKNSGFTLQEKEAVLNYLSQR